MFRRGLESDRAPAIGAPDARGSQAAEVRHLQSYVRARAVVRSLASREGLRAYGWEKKKKTLRTGRTPGKVFHALIFSFNKPNRAASSAGQQQAAIYSAH